MAKYVKHLTNDELLERLAEDMMQMHLDTGIDLGYWETGLEAVSRFYNIGIQVRIGDKKNV
jgi:hypothetical protein